MFYGVGILSTPYAAKEGGQVGLSILFIFRIPSLYTGLLLHSCLDSEPGLETYPEIGKAAFGIAGRISISYFCVCYGSALKKLAFNARGHRSTLQLYLLRRTVDLFMLTMKN
ncbi:hypothetical protein RYX36_024648 [Vicia faba]